LAEGIDIHIEIRDIVWKIIWLGLWHSVPFLSVAIASRNWILSEPSLEEVSRHLIDTNILHLILNPHMVIPFDKSEAAPCSRPSLTHTSVPNQLCSEQRT
jgi:hypothetical protein